MLIVFNCQNQVSKGSKTSTHQPICSSTILVGLRKVNQVVSLRLPKNYITKTPENRPGIPKGNEKVFQPSIVFAFAVSFREANLYKVL